MLAEPSVEAMHVNGNLSLQQLEWSVDLFEKPEAIAYESINKCLQEDTLCFQRTDAAN